ncbi:uncharacterized protein LOC130106257 isoform X2 [Rhinichthys klamathensis goyatoka]|uniref:uncharacterized protein LOC130106257 isoform X2 n=1 Tax=Rhinichthys klamathensis goyatoka TaxID=3034132 RepID=UPI0024B61751|nr:uncharacterized protein LOC130106257 isoform X2 [Rhinichthys klamathensis goyatoka]
MIGKVWIFITAFSFITYIHHAQCECMPQDLKTHLYDELLEDHIFEIKIFPSETKENELLSVINTLCSSWTKNKNKDKRKFKILTIFEIMLKFFQESNFEMICADLNCTDSYTVSWVNATVFGDMYRRSCDGSISDLKCPSKSKTTISPSITAVENKALKDAQSTINTCSGVLVFSLLLNIGLFLLVLNPFQKKKPTAKQVRLLLARHL